MYFTRYVSYFPDEQLLFWEPLSNCSSPSPCSCTTPLQLVYQCLNLPNNVLFHGSTNVLFFLFLLSVEVDWFLPKLVHHTFHIWKSQHFHIKKNTICTIKRQWLFLTLSGNWGSRENWYFIYVLESTTGTNNFLLSKSKIRLKFLIKILTYYAFMTQDKVYIPPKFQTFSAKLHGSKKGMCKTLWVVNLTFLLKFMYFSLCYTKYIVYLCSSVPASYP